MIISDLDIDAYHRSKRVSHSKLKTLASKGPRGYFMAHEQGSWREPDKDAYLVGRALEDALQRPQFFTTHYATKPEGMTFAGKEGKVWRAFATAAIAELDGECAALAKATSILMAEPEAYWAQYAVKPAGMSFAKKEGKEWRDAQGARTILDAED